MPQGPFVEERHDFHSTEAERDAMTAAVVERGGMVVKRREMLGGLFAAGVGGSWASSSLFPLLRSLGPSRATHRCSRPTGRRARMLVTVDGRQVTVDDLEVGGVLTVFPEGFEGSSPDQVILIRLAEIAPAASDRPPGAPTGASQGYVAYSKMCTHLGCPVGLYQEQTQQLVCPCHQSIFNVVAGAIPEFGPAPRPLPQLPHHRGLDRVPAGEGRLRPGRRPRILGAPMIDKSIAPLGRRPPRHRQGRPDLPRQDLPRPLVVHARARSPSTRSWC